MSTLSHTTRLNKAIPSILTGLVDRYSFDSYRSNKGNFTITVGIFSDEEYLIVTDIVITGIQEYAESLGLPLTLKGTKRYLSTACYEYTSLDKVPYWIQELNLTPEFHAAELCELCGEHPEVWEYSVPKRVLEIKFNFKESK